MHLSRYVAILWGLLALSLALIACGSDSAAVAGTGLTVPATQTTSAPSLTPTSLPFTATAQPFTATPPLNTASPVPPTATATSLPPTPTLAPPTATLVPSPTPVPFTATPLPPTATATPAAPPPDLVAVGIIAEPPVRNNERWIDFNLRDGITRLMEGRKIVRELPSAYGYGMPGSPSDFYSTAPGQYRVYQKREPLYYDAVYSGYYFVGWVGFDPVRANGFHSYLLDAEAKVVDSQLGPVSHGCIRTDEWKVVFDFAYVGMPVIVHGASSVALPAPSPTNRPGFVPKN